MNKNNGYNVVLTTPSYSNEKCCTCNCRTTAPTKIGHQWERAGSKVFFFSY